MNLLLIFIALILLVVFLLPSLFCTIIYAGRLQSWEVVKSWLWSIAYALDQLGNVIVQHLFNVWMITPESSHHFGNPDETVSSVMGKNERAGTLSPSGKLLVSILHWLDPNHSIDAIEDDE